MEVTNLEVTNVTSDSQKNIGLVTGAETMTDAKNLFKIRTGSPPNRGAKCRWGKSKLANFNK